MLKYVGWLLRLVVGGVWIWAGALKLPHPQESITAVRAYQLLPLGSTGFIGHVLPILEVVIGAILVLGLLTRIGAVGSALLQIAFIVGISSVWARGIPIDCGCFGGGGYDPNAFSKYPWEIARDSALLLASLYLVWRPHAPLSLDGVLFPEPDHGV